MQDQVDLIPELVEYYTLARSSLFTRFLSMFRIFKAIQKIVTALNLRRNEVVSVLVRVMILGKSSQSPEELYNKIDEFFAKTLNSTEAQNNLKAIASKGRTEIAKRELEKARSFYYACSKCLVGSF